ncbi:MAG: MFS transporter [Novosphingobium sp.]|nr:MFS transporter [Novosphingobium sp.]
MKPTALGRSDRHPAQSCGMTTPVQRVPLKLVLFFLVLHIVNQIDRQLVAALPPTSCATCNRRAAPCPDRRPGVQRVYAFTSVALGLLADRLGRVRVLTGGVAVWSLFTALAGMAQGFWTTLAARPLVAAGEATLVPTASNIIPSRTPDRHKAAAIGLFGPWIPLGIGGSFLIAGSLGPTLGWRGCFLMMGPIGISGYLLGLWRARSRPAGERGCVDRRAAGAVVGDAPRHNRRLRWASLAIVFLRCSRGHQPVRPAVAARWTRAWAQVDANSLYGVIFVTFGLAGSVGSGLLADSMQRCFALDRALSTMIVLAALVPLILAYRLLPAGDPLFIAGMAVSVLFMTMLLWSRVHRDRGGTAAAPQGHGYRHQHPGA